MTKHERKELNAAIAELLAEHGDHLGALERLCRLAGMRVAPIVPGEPMTVLEVVGETVARGSNYK